MTPHDAADGSGGGTVSAGLLGLLWAVLAGRWAFDALSARVALWPRPRIGTEVGRARPDETGGRWQAHHIATPVARGEPLVSRSRTGWSGGAATVAVRAVESIGRRVGRALGRAGDPVAERRLGLAVGVGVVLLPLHPVLAGAPALVALVGPRLAARRQARRHESAVVDQLPDVVDLLRLTTAAGLPVSAAVTAIGARPGGVVGGALARAATLIAHGGTTAAALRALHDACGPAVRPLVDALADHDRYGTALGPALDRVGVESRLRRRRQAEEAARRLPIALLFPLVLTTLPAFVLLTILPLLAGSFSSLQL